jgi:hypothetical protein
MLLVEMIGERHRDADFEIIDRHSLGYIELNLPITLIAK